MVKTSKHGHSFVWIYVAAVVLTITISGMLIGNVSYIFDDYGDVKKEYADSRSELNAVREYFERIDSSNIIIWQSTGDGMMSNSGHDVPVDDVKADKAIERLQERGYSVIAKNGNTIYFQRWSNLDKGMGLAYTADGTAPRLQFLANCSMIDDNWYYYEENYNLWRHQDNNEETRNENNM